MTTGKKFASGTTISRAGVVIAELVDISCPGITLKTIDAGNHQSTGGFDESIGGVLSGGDVTIKGNWIPGDTNGQVALITDCTARTLQTFVITSSDGSWTWTFTALVTKAPSITAPHDAGYDFDATVHISGVPALGITAAPNLSALVLTTATLVPTFAAGTYTYVATTTGTSYTVTPTCATADSITVNGNVVATGVPSSAIPTASVGTYALSVVVIKAGYVSKTYTITVAKTA
jgi:hypothetical protein